MAIDTAIYVSAPGRTSAYLDWLQMLTGAALILFMWSHMVLVASVNLGANVMNAIAWFFEASYMAQVGGPLIGCTFLLHFVLAARKIPFRAEQQRVIWKHSRMLHHLDTWLWLVQAFTAMIILIMGAIHMWTVLTDLPITAQKSAARIQGGFWLVFYLILLPMVELHVGIGFYRIAVKWGFIRKKTRKPFKKFENILTGIFILIGLLTLVRFMTLAVE
ncbi:MAG: succinate dehydrogenase/fumarate reductase cytochrome b subunit [Deltaproteobacteria bacterium]|nr:succinate dehydrogenase/fumarate reductase cytochrome b subunit [Deltaproteobacteria bacterium]MBW1817288.1 succinate dehydrogenase/fumarate reductase cytochrome b subunit [Deltaproteobacteria bacterium]MBW2284537.1 succinate dehydrogenase/fumarate reductase cytochrome b subunit [Deltaproteobacteria bacterium]